MKTNAKRANRSSHRSTAGRISRNDERIPSRVSEGPYRRGPERLLDSTVDPSVLALRMEGGLGSGNSVVPLRNDDPTTCPSSSEMDPQPLSQLGGYLWAKYGQTVF